MEMAGLALGIFPIVVSGLQFYADGTRTIKDLWRPEAALRDLIRELGIEKCKFDNTCKLLLGHLMVSDSDFALLIENLGGAQWNANDLQKKLKDNLGEDTAHQFMEAMNTLNSSLRKLQCELRLNKDKPELANKRAVKKNFKRIWTVLHKGEYKEQLTEIAKINADLAILTDQGVQSKTVNNPLQAAASAKHYKRIRDHAINLYSVLKEKFQISPSCACTIPHNANLRLEARNIVRRGNNDQDTSLRFHVVLSFESDPPAQKTLPWNWREIELEPLDGNHEPSEAEEIGDPNEKRSHRLTAVVEETSGAVSHPRCGLDSTSKQKPPSEKTTRLFKRPYAFMESPQKMLSEIPRRRERERKPMKVSFSLPQADCPDPAPITPDATSTHTKRIEDLCLAIQKANSDLKCFGVLTDENHQRYRVWQPSKPSFASEPTRVLSLENLLTQPGTLKRKDRLILGVQLASTVMQLHATGWLDESWGKRDILFHQAPTQGIYAINSSRIAVQPFVRRIFGPSSLPPQTTHEPTKLFFERHSQCLFSLGVILVELWYGKCLEELWIEDDGINGRDVTKRVTAWRLAREISDEAGERYGDAVRRCINGLDHRPEDANLEKDDFKLEVHMKVVSPLVDNLKSFSDTEGGGIL